MNAVPELRLNETPALPPSAVTVNFGELFRAPWVSPSATFAFTQPMVVFDMIVPHHGSFYPTPDGLLPASAGWFFDPSINTMRFATMEFTGPVSRIRLYGSVLRDPATLRCRSQDGREVTSTIPGSDQLMFTSWAPLDVSLPNIVSCTFEGFALFISALVFVPQEDEQPTLTVECNGDRGRDTVTRGEMLTCVASKLDGAPGDITVTKWLFNGQERSGADATSLTWSGVMVKDGTVELRGTIGNSAEQVSTAAITVMARDWSMIAPTVASEEVEPTDPRLEAADFPDLPLWQEQLGATEFYWNLTARPDPTAMVDGGPNDGLYYYADLPFSTVGLYAINRVALSATSRFARLQVERGADVGTNYCDRRSLPSQIPRIEAHERAHVKVYEEAFTRRLRLRATTLERMTSAEAGPLFDEFDRVREELDRASKVESESVVDSRGSPYLTDYRDSRGHRCVMKAANGNDLVSQRTGR